MDTNSSSTTTKVPRVDYHVTGILNRKYMEKLPGAVQCIVVILTYCLDQNDPRDTMGFRAGKHKFTITFFKTPESSHFSGRSLIIGHGPSTNDNSFIITLRHRNVLFTGRLKLEPMNLPFTQTIHTGLKTLIGNLRELEKLMKLRGVAPSGKGSSKTELVSTQSAHGVGKNGFPILSEALGRILSIGNDHVTETKLGVSIPADAHPANHLDESSSRQNDPRTEEPTEESASLPVTEFPLELLKSFLIFVDETRNEGKGWEKRVRAKDQPALRAEFLSAHDSQRFNNLKRKAIGAFVARFVKSLKTSGFIHLHQKTKDWYLSTKGAETIGVTRWERIDDVGILQYPKPQKVKVLPLISCPGAQAVRITTGGFAGANTLRGHLAELQGMKTQNESMISALVAENSVLDEKISTLETEIEESEARERRIKELEAEIAETQRKHDAELAQKQQALELLRGKNLQQVKKKAASRA